MRERPTRSKSQRVSCWSEMRVCRSAVVAGEEESGASQELADYQAREADEGSQGARRIAVLRIRFDLEFGRVPCKLPATGGWRGDLMAHGWLAVTCGEGSIRAS